MKNAIRLFLRLTIFLAMCGCNLPIGPGAPTPLPATPSRVPPSPAFSSRRFFIETFDSEPRDWNITQINGDANLFRAFVENGHWNFLLEGEYIYAYAVYEPATYREARLDVRVANRGANRNLTSLICHFDADKGWYEFAISTEGTYHILFAQWDAKADEVTYSPLADGISAAILPGLAENNYSVICSGTFLTLIVNDARLIAFNEDEHGLNNGKIGVGVSSFDVLPVRLEFDSIAVGPGE
ncbi:MAG: hypothetical protein AB1750_02455 [Chloroflexota bacterium]